jgi:hypothetical protein
MIAVTIEAHRKRPLTRPAQLEAIIKRFGLVPRCEYTATDPLTYVLNESAIESNNGAELTVELEESDAPKALDIVASFVAAALFQGWSDMAMRIRRQPPNPSNEERLQHGRR